MFRNISVETEASLRKRLARLSRSDLSALEKAAELMLQVADGPGRRFRTAPLDRPFGRGVNFQLELDNVESAYRTVVDAGHEIVVALEERWYRVGADAVGRRQFVVADPDGYLIRPFTSLGARDA